MTKQSKTCEEICNFKIWNDPKLERIMETKYYYANGLRNKMLTIVRVTKTFGKPVMDVWAKTIRRAARKNNNCEMCSCCRWWKKIGGPDLYVFVWWIAGGVWYKLRYRLQLAMGTWNFENEPTNVLLEPNILLLKWLLYKCFRRPALGSGTIQPLIRTPNEIWNFAMYNVFAHLWCCIIRFIFNVLAFANVLRTHLRPLFLSIWSILMLFNHCFEVN